MTTRKAAVIGAGFGGLALAVRLEITDEISADEAAQRPDNDPRAWLHEIYSWVGWVQESLLDAL